MRILGFIGVSIILIVAAFVLVSVSQDNDQPISQKFYIEIKDINESSEQSILKVFKGNSVTFHITTAAHGSFHLHGYDLELEVNPGQGGQLQFDANTTGSFPYTFHIENAHEHSHSSDDETEHDTTSTEREIQLGRLEVYPQ